MPADVLGPMLPGFPGWLDDLDGWLGGKLMPFRLSQLRPGFFDLVSVCPDERADRACYRYRRFRQPFKHVPTLT